MAIKWSNEQLEAINKDNCNIIVSAGAGSGKTAVLTTRIERKLLEGCRADQLLVLTFTNAAAAEMKERIVKKMKANEMLKNRSEEVDQAYITTFDSFSLSIVKKYHDRLNLSNNISIMDSSILNVYKRKVLNEIFDNYFTQNDPLFDKFLSELTVKNENPIKKAIFKVSSDLDLLTNKEEYLNTYIEKYQTEEMFDKYLLELTAILNDKIEYIKKNLNFIKLVIDESQYICYYEALRYLISSKTYDEIRYNCKVKMPKYQLEDEAKVYKEEIQEVIKDIGNLCVFTNAEYAKQEFLSSKDYLKIIINIIKEFDVKINTYKMQNEAFEFIDIAKLAIKLVKENSDIQNELKDQFKEILIDEYQDTSDLQEEFISYIAKDNVYMVGDIKQSIYRFRNANPMIFKNKYDLYRKEIDGYKIDLNKNFRSNHQVLNFINDVFDHIMDDKIGNADFKNEHRMHYGFRRYDDGINNQKIKYLTYANFEKKYKNSDIDIFIILKDIQEKLKKQEIVYDKDEDIFRPCEYKDFAILISSSTDFNTIKDLLEYNHIPAAIVKNEEVSNGIIVQLILNIIKLLTFDYKKEYSEDFLRAYYSLARSFLCEINDETLFDEITNSTYKDSELYQKIAKLSKKIKDLTLKQILENVIEDFAIIENLIKIGDINANMTRIEYILNIAKKMESLSLDIFDFVDYVDDIFTNNEKLEFASSNLKENKVKIMTIHKSKGLEYPIVYFVENFKLFNKDELKEKIIFDNKYGIITPFYDQGEGKNINYLLMKEKNNLDMVSEEIRLLYVALTRAREQIIIVNPINKSDERNYLTIDVLPYVLREKYNSFKSIYRSLEFLFEPIKEEVNIDLLNINDDYKKQRKINYSELISKTNLKVQYIENVDNSFEVVAKHASKNLTTIIDQKQKEYMEKGTALHEIFEIIDFKNPDYSTFKDYEIKYIKRFLNQKIMKNIDKANIFKEYEFIMEDDKETLHGIIDLMIEYSDYIDIIDYKLKNVEDDNYLLQLNKYKSYIENKTKKQVNLYLYSILEDNLKKVSEVYV